MPCAAGTSSISGGTCTICDAGKFSVAGDICNDCPTNTFAANAGSTSCLSCGQNFVSGIGTTVCTVENNNEDSVSSKSSEGILSATAVGGAIGGATVLLILLFLYRCRKKETTTKSDAFENWMQNEERTREGNTSNQYSNPIHDRITNPVHNDSMTKPVKVESRNKDAVDVEAAEDITTGYNHNHTQAQLSAIAGKIKGNTTIARRISVTSSTTASVLSGRGGRGGRGRKSGRGVVSNISMALDTPQERETRVSL